ncbi:hypothetical protein AGMMS49579_25010 [Spirochaetia bacterium]|nr:hypothetical protein AGMMS49579_25010 [Spirochaetia bacterium]
MQGNFSLLRAEGPVIIKINRELVNPNLWLPLEGLPRHRFYSNTVYEIIDEEILARLTSDYGIPGDRDRLVLRGEEIPRFAAAHERLIYRFATGPLRRLLSEENVFILPEKLSLTLTARTEMLRGAGQAQAKPTLKYGKRLYPAAEVSSLMERDYILLDDKWAPQKTLKETGVLPLGYLVGGAPIEEYRLGAAEILRRGGKNLPQFFTGLEFKDPPAWLREGPPQKIFISHLEFLRAWGISGGVILHGHREQAECLSAWLTKLAASIKKDGRIIVLMEKEYCELYLSKFLPQIEDDIKNSGVEISFYEDLTASKRLRCDILVLVEPEEVSNRNDIQTGLSQIDTQMRLGIFSDFDSYRNIPGLKSFFGLRRDTQDLEPHIIRNARAVLSLPPQYQWSAGKILRPPGIFNFTVEKKFRNISAQDLIAERDASRRDGKSMTNAVDVILRARELILFVDDGPEKNLTELLELYTAYRADFPGLDRTILPWIMDFVFIYNIPDAIPRLLPFVQKIKNSIITDLYLHHIYIDENNPINIDDIRLLSITVSSEKESGRVLDAIDRYLREHFKIRFFEFFYPPIPVTMSFTAFEGLEGIGESSYTAEWVSFSSHRPLLNFLDTLLRYIAYRTRAETDFDKRRQVPPLSGVWKEITDAVLEQRELRVSHVRGGTALKKETLEKLRDDSEKVQKLLRIEYSGSDSAPPSILPAPPVAPSPALQITQTANRSGGALAEFLTGLGPIEGEALRIIADGGDLSALETLAQKGLTMPELIVDDINGQFNDLFSDILIEIVDEAPLIQAEYEAEIKGHYKVT